MCNALSPEKAVIWAVIHDLAPCGLRDEHFTHPIYRLWFNAAGHLKGVGRAVDVSNISDDMSRHGTKMTERDLRALKRMVRISPPPRIRNNARLLVQALIARDQGQEMHIERLIN